MHLFHMTNEEYEAFLFRTVYCPDEVYAIEYISSRIQYVEYAVMVGTTNKFIIGGDINGHPLSFPTYLCKKYKDMKMTSINNEGMNFIFNSDESKKQFIQDNYPIEEKYIQLSKF